MFFCKILSRFFDNLSLYIFPKVCYNAHMNIFTYLQEKRKKNEQQRTYEGTLSRLGLSFPLFCKVHAVKSPDHQGAIAQSRVGDHLLIVHTPSDIRPDCVCVYNVSLNRVLGYIDEDLSSKLVTAFGQSFCRDGEVEQITGGAPYKYLGCNLRLMDTQDFLAEMEEIPSIE